jgi:hypothetical protein
MILISPIALSQSSSNWISFSEETATRLWGSLSVSKPTAGYYGQQFEIKEQATMLAMSIYISDHDDHDEAGAIIHFGIWQFDEMPGIQVASSGPQKIGNDEVGSWKTYFFEADVTLSPGRYLAGVGQEQEGQFVAFGNGPATEENVGRTWIRVANSSSHTGWTHWFQPKSARTSAECPSVMSCALMLRIALSE